MRRHVFAAACCARISSSIAYQLLEARAAGADAVLLIAECLDDCHLRALHNEALELGLTPLVELYEPANLARVLDAGATLIGINNRDLRTFEINLDHTLRLRQQVPDGCLLVSESGIPSRADVVRLEAAGVDAILVGESADGQRRHRGGRRRTVGRAPVVPRRESAGFPGADRVSAVCPWGPLANPRLASAAAD